MSLITNSAHTVNTDAQPFQPDEYIPGYASKLLRRSEYFFALGVLTTGSASFLLGRAKLAKRLGCCERTVSRDVTRLEALGYVQRRGQDCPRFGQWGGMLILPGPKMWGLIADKKATLLHPERVGRIGESEISLAGGNESAGHVPKRPPA